MAGRCATIPPARSGSLTLLRTCGSAPRAAHGRQKNLSILNGGRAEILAQKPASGEPSEGFGRVSSASGSYGGCW